MRVTILDGYVDEPSRLGVPPFMSPYPRYAAGAVLDAGHEPEYMTIDHWRAGRKPTGDMLFIISGALVPGKYLRTMPMSEKELVKILDSSNADTHVWHSSEPSTLPGNQARHAWGCDPDALVYDLLTSGTASKRRRTREEWASWPTLGAGAIAQHQDFPQPLICEIDMSYGCPHYITGGCSFCTEPLFGMPVFRDEEAIVSEIKALLKFGCTNFRLGGQSCIFSYKAIGIGETSRPKPNVRALSDMFSSIARLKGIRVLHTDNADPAIIAGHQEESRKILDILVGTCTSGNLLSLGLESADPIVAEKNNLNSTSDEALTAIKLINAAGSDVGPSGLPKLLPGLNILAGLEGESAETFDTNRNFLLGIIKSDLMLRRINIRQVAPTRRNFKKPGNKKSFIHFKEFVRGNIDPVMLAKVAPAGAILRDVYTEVAIGKLMFARQIGTYPILIGIPQTLESGRFLEVKITAHGGRSLTAVEFPLDPNSCQLSALEALPGVGRKRAIRLFNARPMTSVLELEAALEEKAVSDKLVSYFGDHLEK